MSPSPDLIMSQFLQWVAAGPRRREDVLDAWESGGEAGEHRVELTERGRTVLGRA